MQFQSKETVHAMIFHLHHQKETGSRIYAKTVDLPSVGQSKIRRN